MPDQLIEATDFTPQTIQFLAEQGAKAWLAHEKHQAALEAIASLEREMSGEAKAFERMFEVLTKLEGKNPGAYEVAYSASEQRPVIYLKPPSDPPTSEPARSKR